MKTGMGPQRLPLPDSEARAHSARVSELIAAEIDAAGGALRFDRYMQLALYAPGLGYYSSGLPAFGEGGDFVTAPELGPMYARTLARQCVEVLKALGGGEVLEFGAGSGAFGAEFITELVRLDAPFDGYRILEVSGPMRERQRAAIAARGAGLPGRTQWLDTWPTMSWRGVALGNEVLDAMPVRCFRLTSGRVLERCVARAGERFAWVDTPATPEFAAEVCRALGADLATYPDGFVGELTPNLYGWFLALAEHFERGVALLVDYGDARQGRYRASRTGGTLRAYYRQRVHDDPFWYPGLCDLTADVDFSAVAAAASAAGFGIAGFTPQAQMLLGGGLEAAFSEAFSEAPNTAAQLRLAQEVKRLTLPDEMGERFRAIALTRGEVGAPSGFGLRDLRDRL